MKSYNVLLIFMSLVLSSCVIDKQEMQLSIKNAFSNSNDNAAPVFAGDTYWNDTVLLLRCENGTMEDVKNNYSLTNTGSVGPDSTITKFGAESCLFGGGYTRLTDNAFILDSMDYTVEVWVHPLSTGFYSIIGTASRVGGGMKGWGFTSEYGVMGTYQTGGIVDAPSPGVVAANVWSHIAIVKTGGFLTYYLNGVAQVTAPVVQPEAVTSNILSIGTIAYDQVNYGYSGYMDEIRITKVARYVTDFIPSNDPYPAF